MRIVSRSLALAAMIAAGSAQAHVLDFGSFGDIDPPAMCTLDEEGLGAQTKCLNHLYISQSYGDVAGIVDVSYSAPRVAEGRSLRWYGRDYNDLMGAVWAEGTGSDSLARIDIVVPAGQALTLNSFHLGAYLWDTRETTVTITEMATGAVLFSFNGPIVGGDALSSATLFTPSIVARGGLSLEWRDDAHNVAIDNIDFSVGPAPVPEPGTWALLAAGLAFVGASARKRQA